MRLAWALLAAAWCTSCGGTDESRDASIDRLDPNCHYDCFGHTECRDGRVTKWAHTPVPCPYWTGQCPIERALVCAQGCRVNGVNIQYPFFMNVAALCRETPARAEGDSCMTDDGCLPTPATVHPDGTVTNYYLRCDLATHRCVAAPAPQPSGWLSACAGANLAPFRGTGRYGTTEAVCDGGGYCLFADDATAGCVKQGCSVACTGDQDCQPGAICSDQLSYWFEGRQLPPVPVCKPGAPSAIGFGLMCF